MAYGRGFGEMRGAALGKRGYLVQFEPRLSATGAVADEWVPVLPGTEGLVALAIGAIMVELGLGKVKESQAAAMFKAVDVNGIAAASGVSVEKLHSLAEMFAKFARPTAIPGGGLSGHTNAPAAMAAVLALNALAGRADKGGAFHLTPPTADPALVAATPSSFADVQALIKKMQAGGVDVLFLAGNPLYDLPAAAGFAQALANVPLVVSFSSIVDESAVQADLILPDHSYLESWGYQVTAPAADRPAVSSQQPVVAPLFDTRATTDVLLDLANRVGGAVKQALPWPNTVAFMKDVTAKLVGKNAAFVVKNAEQVWAGWRQMGGWWPTEVVVAEPKGTAALGQRLDLQRPRFDGDDTAFPFYLYPYPALALSDGRGATQPWLQEAPDPMTTAAWDTWVEINPETAQKLGLKRNDVVKILTSTSLALAVVYPYPGIHPDVIAVPLGQGHADSGRYAKNRGANVISILSPQTTADGELAWGATRVKLELLGRTRILPVIESNIGVATANEEKHIPGW